jgi:hypothetical protein
MGLPEGANASRSKTQPVAMCGDAGWLAGVLSGGAAVLAAFENARTPDVSETAHREVGNFRCANDGPVAPGVVSVANFPNLGWD